MFIDFMRSIILEVCSTHLVGRPGRGREVDLIGNPIPYLLWAYFVMFIDALVEIQTQLLDNFQAYVVK